ncbi:hypothetical protein [Massilia aurea]|uniref:hypothetical protein n=1 Tax=Massilia aurea TaxID=373040 RepID=UPI0011CE44C9|nr:hypothetical protein [Massilia aurea]
MNDLPARDVDFVDIRRRYALRFKLLIFHRNPNVVRQKKKTRTRHERIHVPVDVVVLVGAAFVGGARSAPLR